MKNPKGILMMLVLLFAGLAVSWSFQNDEQKPVTLVEFNKIVSNQDTVVLVYCSASWCGVCKKMQLIIDEFENYHSEKMKILHIDADRDREINEEFELNTLPFIMLYKKGIQKWTRVGFIDKLALKSKIYFALF
jgi:thioredoxin 1